MEPHEWLCFAGNISKKLRKTKVQWKRGRLALKKTSLKITAAKKKKLCCSFIFFSIRRIVKHNRNMKLYTLPVYRPHTWGCLFFQNVEASHIFSSPCNKKRKKNCYVNTWCFFMFVGISWESSQNIAKKTLYWNKCSEISLLLFCEAGKAKDQILSSEFDTFTLLM